MSRFCALGYALLGALFVLSTPAVAQNLSYSSRAQIRSPYSLGMGDATAAVASSRSVFFYNPAHLTSLPEGRSPVVIIGGNGTFSTNFSNQLSFYSNEFQPAISGGLENLAPQDLEALYTEALTLGQERTFISGDILLPSFAMNKGTFGVGGGLFMSSNVHYFVAGAEATTPTIDLFSQADFMALANGALNMSTLGIKGLSLGVTGKFTQRYLMLKNELVDQLGGDENYYILGGSTMSLDVGFQYDLKLRGVPGRFHLGGALYDAVGGDFTYKHSGYYDRNSDEDDLETIDAEIALANERLRSQSTYRAGIAYTTPRRRGFLQGARFAADYFNDPGFVSQGASSNYLHVGAQLDLTRALAIRTGWMQGHPSVGASLDFLFATIDYAYHYQQENGLPGGWNHSLQIALGSF